MKAQIGLMLIILASLQSCYGTQLASPHIVNGEEVVPHSYPHQVALGDYESDVFCGGALISDRWVVTAAHCVDKRTGIKVVLGAHDIEDYRENTKTVRVEKKIVHPDWSRKTYANDIALLKLQQSVQTGKTIKPIRLPKISEKNSLLWHTKATMTGWGKTTWDEYWGSATLRATTDNIISNIGCKVSFLFRYVRDSNICTSGWHSKGTCFGDSGSPLVIREWDGDHTLIGLTSFGFPICHWKWPSVFTRITYYLDWIHEETGIASRP